MVEVHRLPDMNAVERAASDWVARLNADDASASDRVRFEQWRTAHPSHARAYDAMAATWHELVRSGPLIRAVSFGQAMNGACAPRPGNRRWALASLAAVLVAVLAAGVYMHQAQPETLFQTAIGEHATVALPDGSSLELNSNSLATLDYREHVRVVRLQRGEAFFKVAHDTTRPFWVVAGNSWVRAVGTAFNVYIRPADVQVTVSEGTVKVAGERSRYVTPSDPALADAAVSVLTAGEQADLAGRGATIRRLQPQEAVRSAAWQQGSIYFEDQPLHEVVTEMARYTSLKIEIGDDSLARLTIGGTFRAGPEGAEALLTLLQDGFGLTVRHDGKERVYIEAPKSQ